MRKSPWSCSTTTSAASRFIRQHGFHLQGILTSYEGVKEGYRKVVIRTNGKGNFNNLKSEIERTFKVCEVRKG
jgi:hypothetical protein